MSKNQIIWGCNYYAKHIPHVGRIVWDKMPSYDKIRKTAYAWGVDEQWAVDRKIEFIEQEIRSLKIQGIEKEKAFLSTDRTGRHMLLVEKKELTKNIGTLEMYLLRLKYPERRQNGVTDDEIARAKAYPIALLAGVNKGKIFCLWHDDRNNPSMSIFNNVGYCFTCQKHADTIEFARKKYNETFIEAVRRLQNYE